MCSIPILNYVQTITVTPAPAPSFVSTPNDTTILCADAASYVAAVTVLAYTNNETASCEISGTVDRKSVVEGKRGDLGGRRIIKKKKKNKQGFYYVQTITVKPVRGPSTVSTPNE